MRNFRFELATKSFIAIERVAATFSPHPLRREKRRREKKCEGAKERKLETDTARCWEPKDAKKGRSGMVLRECVLLKRVRAREKR